MKRSDLEKVMDQLAEMPCGGTVGANGATMADLKAVEKEGYSYFDNAVLHVTQRAWRMLERLLPQCRKEKPGG